MIYDYEVTTGKGEKFSLSEFKGKVFLIVNTATGCGFTPQYEPLEKLYKDYHEKGLLYVATTYNWAKVVTLDGPRRFALDQTRFHLDGHGISSVTRPGFALDPPGSALDPAEPCSCTLRKALPLQSAKGLRPLYSGPIKHKRIILSTGIILLSFIGSFIAE